MESGDSSVVSAKLMTESLHVQLEVVQVPAGAEGEFLLMGQLSVLTLILVSVPLPCYHNST